MELILKAKDIRVEFKGRTCLDIDELVSLAHYTLQAKSCVLQSKKEKSSKIFATLL